MVENEMSCLLQIRSIRDEMSANEKKLADFILTNSALLRDYSSQQLASAVGVSQSSVVKFCQKLGFKGYPDIKMAVSEAIAKNSSVNGDRSTKRFANAALDEVSDKLLKNKLEAVTATIELNNEDSFISSIDAIKSASRILIVGSGSSNFVAKHFAVGLIQAGKVAFSSSDSTYQSQFLKTLAENDVLILLSSNGGLNLSDAILKDCRARDVKIIRIGKYSSNTNYHMSDIYLSTISKNETEDPFGVAKRAAQQHVVDILLALSS